MTTLEALASRVDVYSIDEAFLDLTGIDRVVSFEPFGRQAIWLKVESPDGYFEQSRFATVRDEYSSLSKTTALGAGLRLSLHLFGRGISDVINKRTDFKGVHQVKNDQSDENHDTVKSLGINDLIGRQLKEPTHIDQLFVELSTGLTLSILERHFDINLPDGCPKASLAPLDVFEALSSGPFGIFSQYLDSLADLDERNRLAEIALGPPMQQHFSPVDVEKELTIDVHELGRQLVKEAEYLCDALDDRPIIHLLATELQHKASEMWYTPPPRFCLIDSKYGNLRASGIFSASHALASQGYIEPAKRLIQGLYDINPRPILEV